MRFAVGGKRCGQHSARISTVFWQSERCGSDIESAGIIDDLVNRDMCVGVVKEAIDQCIDLPEFTYEIAGEALIGAAWPFAGVGSTNPSSWSHEAIVERDGVKSGPTVSNKK